jgi:hypothetical protein
VRRSTIGRERLFTGSGSGATAISLRFKSREWEDKKLSRASFLAWAADAHYEDTTI